MHSDDFHTWQPNTTTESHIALIQTPQEDALPPLALSTTVTVLFPNGGTFRKGEQLTVQWITQGPVGAHAILLSQDNGQTYAPVTTMDLGRTARSFIVPLPRPMVPSVLARVRVAAKEAPNGTRVAVGDSVPFTLLQATAQTTVTVLFPKGETILKGQPLTVQWDTQGPVAFHTLLLSLDNGVTFQTLVDNLSANTWSFTFTPSTSGVIRVVAKDGAGTTLASGTGSFILRVFKDKEKEFKEAKELSKELRKEFGKDFDKDVFNEGKLFDATLPLQSAWVSANASEDRLVRLEMAVGQLMHFISPESRPDLNTGALQGELDVRGIDPVAVDQHLQHQVDDARRAKDAKNVEKPGEG
jgi:hypothetical protein